MYAAVPNILLHDINQTGQSHVIFLIFEQFYVERFFFLGIEILALYTVFMTSRRLKNKISVFIFTLYISYAQISSSANEDSCSVKVHLREDSDKCKYKQMTYSHQTLHQSEKCGLFQDLISNTCMRTG